jgi:hypothetical protein
MEKPAPIDLVANHRPEALVASIFDFLNDYLPSIGENDPSALSGTGDGPQRDGPGQLGTGVC